MPTTAAVTAPGAEDVVVIRDVSFDTYCRLNDENESPAVRMAFFEGSLEIMTVSARHENWGSKIEVLVHLLAEAMGMEAEGFRSVTMRRKDLQAGLEPDACFYFGPMALLMRGRNGLDLDADPAPDLAVEIDISRRSFSKFPLYAALGIPEIWRIHQDEVFLHALVDGDYRVVPVSSVLPRLTARVLTQLLIDGRSLPMSEWMRRIRAAATGPES